jgi:hypothetical protein
MFFMMVLLWVFSTSVQYDDLRFFESHCVFSSGSTMLKFAQNLFGSRGDSSTASTLSNALTLVRRR